MLILTLRTLVVYLALILAMRLMGKRQLGELQPSELVSTILLSNLASISIEQPELPLAASLTPVFLIAVLEVLSSGLALHHPKLALLLSGRPVPVIRNGMIDQNALRALRQRCRLTPSSKPLSQPSADSPAPLSVACGDISPRRGESTPVREAKKVRGKPACLP